MNIVPSRRRIPRLRKMFESLKETGTTTPGIVIIDSKDYFENINGYFDLETQHMLPNWGFYISTGESMGDKLREFWLKYRDLEWASIFNDDHVFRTPQWDQKLISQLNGKNFISTSDGWHEGGKKDLPCGVTMFSGDWYRALGHLFPPGFMHMFCDNYWKDIGLATGSWDIDDTVVVLHEHASRQDAWKDDTHRKSESFFEHDRQRYLQWRNGQGYHEAVAKITRLKNE